MAFVRHEKPFGHDFFNKSPDDDGRSSIEKKRTRWNIRRKDRMIASAAFVIVVLLAVTHPLLGHWSLRIPVVGIAGFCLMFAIEKGFMRWDRKQSYFESAMTNGAEEDDVDTD